MRRSIFALCVLGPFVVGAAVAACTSDDNPAPATGTLDSGAENDATIVQNDSSPPGDDSASAIDAPADTAPSGDSGDGGVTFNCAAWDAMIELDAAEYANADGAPDLTLDGAALPGPAPTVCSLVGDAHAPLTVINNGPCPVDYWWVDYDCKEEYYGTVAAGGQGQNDTFETHPWRIRASGSNALLKDVPPVEATDAWTITYP